MVFSGYIDIPSYGDGHWKSPVATAALLPAVGNNIGDARVVEDTSIVYVWNGSAWVAALGPGGGVSSLNGLTGALTLVAGTGISITPSGSNITITNTATGFTFADSIVNTGGVVTLVNDTATPGATKYYGTNGASVLGYYSIPATGLTSINGDSTAAQTLTVGTSGSDFNIVDAGGGSHVFNLPTSSATVRGALSSADWSTFNSKQAAGNYITALTGDGTATGPGSVAFTLATVNSNVGTFGTASSVSTFTVNGKGLITAASNTAIQITESQVTNLVSDLAAKQGTITIGALDAQTANANGLALVSNVLSTQSATTSFPGMVNNTTQSFSGAKTFTGNLTASASSTTALTVGTNTLIVDTTNGLVGINVAPATGNLLDVVGSTTSAVQNIQVTGYGASAVGYRTRRARGTSGSPTAVQNTDVLGFFGSRGYGATGFINQNTGSINYVATENFSDTAGGTAIAFKTTANTTISLVENMRLNSNGHLLIGTTTDNGVSVLQSAGSSAIGNTAGSVVTIGGASSTTSQTINGGLINTTRTITGNLTLDTTTHDYIVLVTTASGAISITFPAPVNGRTFIIKDISGSANTNNVTMVRNGSEKIEGIAASKILQTPWFSETFVSNGTDWFMI